MRLNTFHIYICWLTILLFAMPASADPAQTMAANPSSVQLNYLPGDGYPTAQVEISSGSGGITNLQIKQVTTDPIGGKTYNWLVAELLSGTSVGFGVDRNALTAISTLCTGACTYTGSVILSAKDMQDLTVSVTLNYGISGSQITAAPTALSFSTLSGALSQAISLTGPSTTYTATATSDANWLSVVPNSGSIPGALTAVANSTMLTPGYTYNGSITITPASGSAITIYATFAVGTAATTTVSPSQMTFSYQIGTSTPGSQSLTVNGPAGTSFTASSGASWMSVAVSSTTLPATVSVSVDPTGLTTSQSGYITITTDTQTIPVLVTLNISAYPLLTATPGQISLNYLIGSTLPAAQTVYISATSNTSVAFSAYASGGWLTLTTTTGVTPGSITFTVNPTGYAAGTYNGYIYVQSSGTANPQLTIPVTLTVSGSGYGLQSFYTAPSALAFTYQGGTTPAAQTINVTSITGLPILFSATATSSGWLTVTPSTAQTPGSLTVAASPSGLTAGTYNGTISITGYGTYTATQTVAVTLTVSQSAALTVSPASLSFNYQSGDSAPAGQTVNVGSSTSQTLSYTTSVSNSWITAAVGGTTPGSLLISVNPASLSPGTYNGTVTINSSSATNSPQTVKVNLVVTAPPTVSASPTSLTYSYRMDGSAPGSQSVQVTSSGAALSYTASSSANWLSVSPASGTTPATLTISVNTANLNPGSYNGTVTVNARTSGGATSSQSVPVTLTVSGPLPTITSVRNAASQTEDGVSPGEIVVIRGTAIGPSDREEAAPTSAGYYASDPLGNTRVLFNGTPAPMLYAQSDEVSAIVPYAMGDRSNTFVQVEYRGVRSNAVTMAVVKSNMGLYTADKSGTGQGMALNDDGSPNSNQNPAAKGSVIMLFGTGEGQVTPAVADGTIPTGVVPQPVLPVSVQIGGVPVPPGDLIYLGTPPGQVAGMFQVSAKIPLTVASGPVPVTLTVGSSSSQPGVVISVR